MVQSSFQSFPAMLQPGQLFYCVDASFPFPLTNSYLTTVSTFSLVRPLQNGEFITRSASIRKVRIVSGVLACAQEPPCPLQKESVTFAQI